MYHLPSASLRLCACCVLLVTTLFHLGQTARAAKVTVDLGESEGVTLVGAVARWDRDGNAKRPVDPKAQIDAPAVDFKAVAASGNQWVFNDLPPGRYDLVILAKNRLRIEGFSFVPVKEFDPILASDVQPDEETRQWIIDDIGKSQHYENKVVSLCLAGNKDKKAVRVLVMLIRDKPTSYEADSPGAATIRHELWQYSWNYGGWQKDKRTKVLDRALLHRDELRKWTWLWDPKLGGIEVGSRPLGIKYDLPRLPGQTKLKGLHPY
jgi:hypothetical protein